MPIQCFIDECSPHRLAGWLNDDGPVNSIDIEVNRRRIVSLSPNSYRKDLEDAGVGDGHRAFSLPMSRYLTEPSNLVEISRCGVPLYSATVPPPNIDAMLAAVLRANGAPPTASNSVLFLQTADLSNYRPLLEVTSRTVMEYCQRHNFSYQSHLGICRGFRAWHATYNRILLLRQIANSGFSGWLCYLDADAYIVDLEFDLAGYLADKRDIAIIVATDQPHNFETPYWSINAGVFFINLSHPIGREIIWNWAEQFDAITDEQLDNAVSWGDIEDDQGMLVRILQSVPGGSKSVLTIRGEPNLINYHTGLFIRQILRSDFTPAERLEALSAEVQRIIATQT